MRFTHLVEKQDEVGERMYAFYEGDALSCVYHQDDLSWEFKQIAFVLNKACNLPCFGYARYEGQTLKLFGCDQRELADLNVKLFSYQFSNRVPLDRQLVLGGF